MNLGYDLCEVRSDLSAEELWLSSSTKEVLAVTTVDGRPFASGRPGPVFKRVHALYQEHKNASRAPAVA